MTEDDLKAIEARLSINIDQIDHVMQREFLTRARQDIPALIAEVRRLRALCIEQRLEGIRDGIEVERLEP